MSNFYQQFSEIIVCNSVEEANWLLNELKTRESTCGSGGFACEALMQEDKQVAIYSEENCDLELLCDILCDFQNKFPDDKAIIVSWADTCSRPITESFGGGALIVHTGKDKWINARIEAENYVKTLKKS
jgi:hypothetical protein